jgi:hypothetical protein
VLADVERLVEARRDQRLVTDLQLVAPLRTQRVDPPADVLDPGEEHEVAAAVREEAQCRPEHALAERDLPLEAR